MENVANDNFPVDNTKEDRNKRAKIWKEFDSTGTGEMTLAEVNQAMIRVLKVNMEHLYVTITVEGGSRRVSLWVN